MSNIYVDLLSGNDTTGTGTNLNPYLTINKAVAMGSDGDEIRVAKTATPSVISISNTTWTLGSTVITTASTHVGTIAIGDYIGKASAAGNGAAETYYRVMSINATQITIEQKYCGTTETVASFKRVVPTTTGAPGVIAASITKALKVCGGWTLATETQDSETWFKANALRTVDVNAISILYPNVIISKMNMVETGRGIRFAGAGSTAEYCTVSGVNLYALTVEYASILSNLRLVGSTTASYGCMYITATDPLPMSNIHITSAAGLQFGTIFVRKTYSNVILDCCSNGTTAVTNITFDNIIARYCINGLVLGSNNRVINCELYGNITAGVSASSVLGSIIENCNIYNNNQGINLATSHGLIIRNNTFTSNIYDVYGDQYSTTIDAINNTHITPFNFAYSKASANGSVWTISECSIDLPSITKAFQIISNANYLTPMYLIQNSFNGLYGAYYNNGQITRDITTSPYSLQIAVNTSTFAALTEYKVGSCYATSGVAKTISYELKANGAWSGTIIPLLQLNGKTIVTGTPITSISSATWDAHSLSALAGDITADGELALVFNYSANVISVNLRNFTVADV